MVTQSQYFEIMVKYMLSERLLQFCHEVSFSCLNADLCTNNHVIMLINASHSVKTDLLSLGIDQISSMRMAPLSTGSQPSAFQSYEPGMLYQPTSQFPSDQIKSKPVPATRYLRSPDDYRVAASHDPMSGLGSAQTSLATPFHDNDIIDTADESDVASIKPSKSRSGNTFTVKKVRYCHCIVKSCEYYIVAFYFLGWRSYDFAMKM